VTFTCEGVDGGQLPGRGRQQTPDETTHHFPRDQDECEKDLAVDALSVPFDEIVTNLNGLPSRMIKMQLYFKVLDEYTFQLIATPPRKVEIRDTILRIIQRKSYQDLETLQGKLLLKNEILTEVNRLLPDGVIRDVYFYEFVIQ